MTLRYKFPLSRYVWMLSLFMGSCAYHDLSEQVDCSLSSLAIEVASKTDATLCNSIDGSISVVATGGEGPYNFNINDGEYQTSSVFENLGPGSYTIKAKDSQGCWVPIQVEITSPASTLTAAATVSADSECFSNNGAITITASLGNPPYEYQFEKEGFGPNATFTNLKFGSYTVTVRDADGCPQSLNINVPRENSGLSYTNDILPILTSKCNTSGCHNGDLGSSRDWTNYNNVKNNAANIKTRTGNRTMPVGGLSLTQQQIDQIACWVDDGAPNN